MIIRKLLIGIALVSPLVSLATQLKSPNGLVRLDVEIADKQLVYSVTHNGNTVIEPSPLGIVIDEKTYGAVEKLGSEKRGEINESYPWRGVKPEVINHCNTLLLDLGSDQKWQIEARAYNDGVAFRYLILGSGTRTIQGELTGFMLPQDTTVWFQGNSAHYEGLFQRFEIGQIPSEIEMKEKMHKTSVTFPVTCQLQDGSYAMLSEANIMGYSGMTLKLTDSRMLLSQFEDDKKGWGMEGTITTPWRLVMVATDLNALVNNDLIHNVCPAPDPELFPKGMATDWVQVGRSLWQWWGYNNPGTHWSRQHWFIDQAAKLNCEYYLVDEGWEHTRQEWFKPGEDAWPRLKELCEYAAERDVKIIVWRSWYDSEKKQFPGLKTEAQREDFFRKCAEAGAKGVKIDFMNSESHDRLEFYEDCLRKGAKYKITVNFHGANKPAGEPRTWPNEVTREGIKGMEHNKWSVLPLDHYSILPFTRMVAGHGDFTPTTFQPEFMRGSTPGLQMAMAVISTSPALHWADKPDVYLESPAVNMIRSMPTCWDETRVLSGSVIGDNARFMRRVGNVWYLAAINSKEVRDYSFKLDFLGKGKYFADIVHDNPEDRDAMIFEKRTVTAKDSIPCKLLDGGGICVRFSKIRMEPFGNGFTEEQVVKIERSEPSDIYYTLDGSEPTTKSKKLKDDSLTFDKSTKLRLKIMDDPATDIKASFIKL